MPHILNWSIPLIWTTVIGTPSQYPMNNTRGSQGPHLTLFFAGSRCPLARRRHSGINFASQALRNIWELSTGTASPKLCARHKAARMPCAEIVEACRLIVRSVPWCRRRTLT